MSITTEIQQFQDEAREGWIPEKGVDPAAKIMSTPRPTPETDAMFSSTQGRSYIDIAHDAINFARKLERERDEARDRAESKHGLWMAELSRVTELEKQLKAMREAIRGAHTIIERYSESAISHSAQLMCPECLRIEAFDEEHKDSCSIGNTLAKLQPFLKP